MVAILLSNWGTSGGQIAFTSAERRSPNWALSPTMGMPSTSSGEIRGVEWRKADRLLVAKTSAFLPKGKHGPCHSPKSQNCPAPSFDQASVFRTN